MLYDDLCETLFHGPGRLHVVYLTQGGGELHLRTADNPPFGVVNIGDSAALYRLLNESDHPDLVLEREVGFAQRLFSNVDRTDSKINIVIGARRFIAGWNSWRVSTMGLMHVGVGEGPEIIQMFGRGVRLKGWNMSLKRHRESGAEQPADSNQLMELETLRIFGLRANYMQTFRDMLETDGINMEWETIPLPVTWNFARKDLKIIRLKEGLKYERSEDRPALECSEDIENLIVEIDLYSRLQTVESREGQDGTQIQREPVKLESNHMELFNRTRIYDKLMARKRRMGWDNLSIDRATVERLLDKDDWFRLYMPPERLVAKSYADIEKLEDIAVELLTEYTTQFWQNQRTQWESDRIEVTTLDESDPNNIDEYQLSVDATQTQLIEDIRTLSSNLQEGPVYRLKLGVLLSDIHAYKPLLYATEKGDVTVQPVPLNINEKQVIVKLAELAGNGEVCLQGHELFLIRNLTRGRGVSFFDDHRYFPDFIVWLKDDENQHIVFWTQKGWSGSALMNARRCGCIAKSRK